MPRPVEAMTAADVAALETPGRYAVGGVAGLSIVVTKRGTKNWVLRTHVNGKRREFGVGGYPTVTLAQARKRARAKLQVTWQEQNANG